MKASLLKVAVNKARLVQCVQGSGTTRAFHSIHIKAFATMVRVLESDTLKSLIAPLLQQKISPATVLQAHELRASVPPEP